jgi:chromosome segregation ATPase
MLARFVMAPPPNQEPDDERSAFRKELDRLRIQLALTAAEVSEAQQQRDRAVANMEKVTACLVECQVQLQTALEREEARLKEMNELRSLVDSHQEEVQVATEARRQTQELCDTLRDENERLRAELAGDVPERQPEPQVVRPMRLVNVAT